jgi:hypothetical protein
MGAARDNSLWGAAMLDPAEAAARLKRQLQILAMPSNLRIKIFRMVGNNIRKIARGNIQKQTDIDGKPFTKRRKASRLKMLRGLQKGLAVFANDQQVVITYGNKLTGQIAFAQQYGITEVMTASKMRQIHGDPNYGAPATRDQAKALRDYGYKIRNNGKWIPASLKWIQQHLSIGQAGLIYRKLSGSKSKKSWDLPGTSRSFLGVNEREIDDMLDEAIQMTLNQLSTAR